MYRMQGSINLNRVLTALLDFRYRGFADFGDFQIMKIHFSQLYVFVGFIQFNRLSEKKFQILWNIKFCLNEKLNLRIKLWSSSYADLRIDLIALQNHVIVITCRGITFIERSISNSQTLKYIWNIPHVSWRELKSKPLCEIGLISKSTVTTLNLKNKFLISSF